MSEHIAGVVSKKNEDCYVQIPEWGIGDRVSEHMAGAKSLRREMRRAVLRYRRGGRSDRMSEHMAGVESLREMGSAVLRYRRGCAIE